LDKFLAIELCDYSRSKIQALISSGNVFVNNDVVNEINYNLRFKDEIIIFDNLNAVQQNIIPEKDIIFSILYEDEDLIVINKPAGLVVHPGAGNCSGTLVNGLAYYCKDNLSTGSEDHRPGIVHRIDKDTSGVLVIAKNNQAHTHLAEQFKVHSIKRKYICFCYGIPQPMNGKIETFIGRDRNNRLKMRVVDEKIGKHAISFYRTLETFSQFATKLECELHTGRTHQIRVHMSHIGHSLIGDSTYKIKNYAVPKNSAEFITKFPRQALHAYFLEFMHPKSMKKMRFEIRLPEDMVAFPF
jgi:23S rRNA pseudouridine1911/1915/1917 synthase